MTGTNVTVASQSPAAVQEMTEKQVELIKATVAKGATNDELRLFLYRAKELGLDPLKPGQIHFVKYGSAPGTIVIGIEGFRSKAASTGKHKGTKRGVVRDDKGLCIGAWCEVYRSDWDHPAREEVSLAEYTTGRGPWAKMPETMIKKVAEVAALRMAFPDQLGGVYAPEEMDQAEHGNAAPQRPVASAKPPETLAEAAVTGAPSSSGEAKDKEAWKETRAMELGFADRRDHVAKVRAVQDDLAGYGFTEAWAAARLAELEKKTLWALNVGELRMLHETVRRVGDKGGPAAAREALDFAPDPHGDGVPF